MPTYSSDAGRERSAGAAAGWLRVLGSLGRRVHLAGAAVALMLFSCQPGVAPTPPRPSGPAGGTYNAPGIPLVYSLELQRYLVEILENHAIKRASRWGLALEPDEVHSEVIPLPRSVRWSKDLDPIEAHFNSGEELFETELTALHGFGDRLRGKSPNFHRVHNGAHGGPDSTSCRSCHHRGGDDGAGEYNEAGLLGGDGESERNANERNPPALGGGGAIQILAREISQELQTQLHSLPSNLDSTIDLHYQGVEFGTVHGLADGGVDLSGVRGIDPDLVVRPFGWKGTHSTLRRFAEEAFQVHHGLQSSALVSRRVKNGTDPRDASPATRLLMDSLGNGSLEDPDQDYILRELSGAHLSAISVYLTLLPMPVILPPRAPDLLAAWRLGGTVFTQVGCPTCHKPSWLITNPVWVERGEDETSRVRLQLDLRKDIRNGPQLSNLDTTQIGYPLFVFSDFRRHDMGPGLADRYAGPAGMAARGPHGETQRETDRQPTIPPSYFLTRPLWGLAESAPYMHDGRSLTINDAIVAHGGEADKARTAYLALPPAQKRALQVFLLALTRQPLPEVSP